MHQMSPILFSVYLDQLYHRAKLIGDLVCVEIAKDSFVSKQVKPKYNKQHSVKPLDLAEVTLHVSICIWFCPQEFLSGLEKFKELEIFSHCDGLYTIKHTEPFHFISRLWSPILTSYWILCSYVLDSCDLGKEYPADILTKNSQEYAIRLFLSGKKLTAV